MRANILGLGTLAAAMLAAAAPAAAQMPQAVNVGPAAAAWKIDTNHSELSFRIRHLVSRVRGTFNEWSGDIVADPGNLAAGSVEVTINTASIDTGNERRDNHLRSDDFFDAEKHPAITFRSRAVDVQGEKVTITGDLTMRGVTKPVVLKGEMTGSGKDSQGRERIGFEASTTVNRQDFGVSWNNLVEGAQMLGDEVQIDIVLAAVRQ